MVATKRHPLLQQEVPFAHPLPHYPVSKAPSLAPTFADKKEVCVPCRQKPLNLAVHSHYPTVTDSLPADTTAACAGLPSSIPRQTHVSMLASMFSFAPASGWLPACSLSMLCCAAMLAVGMNLIVIILQPVQFHVLLPSFPSIVQCMYIDDSLSLWWQVCADACIRWE